MTPAIRGRHVRAVGTLLLCLALTPLATQADSTTETVAKIKAAYLLNFLRFAEWPADSFAGDASPITVCVLGTDTIGTSLDKTMQGQRVHGRPLRIERLGSVTAGADVSEGLRACHLVFIGRSEAAHVDRVTEQLSGSDTLTVGEIGVFAESGAMLALNFEDDRVIFYANPRPIQLARVRLSSKILQLARLVPVAFQGPDVVN